MGTYHVQGTINGYGERCGNANLCSIIPNLQLKLHHQCITPKQLKTITSLSRFVSETANLSHNTQLPYVGLNAFTHKGGIHVSAMARDNRTYQHIDPEIIGNQPNVVISELSGKSNVMEKAKNLGILVNALDAQKIITRIKHQEKAGYQFESADASFVLLIERNKEKYHAPFTILDYLILVEKRGNKEY